MAINGKVLNGNVINGNDSKTVLQALSAVTTSVVSAVNNIGKLISLAQSSAASISKAITKTMSTIAGHVTVLLTEIASHFITLTASVSNSTSIVKQAFKTFTLVQASSLTISRSINKLISIIQSSLVTVKKVIITTLSTIVEHVIVLLAEIASHFITLSITVSSTVSIGRTWLVTLFTAIRAFPYYGAAQGFINGAALNLAAINSSVQQANYSLYRMLLNVQVQKRLSSLVTSIVTNVPQRVRFMIVSVTSTSSLIKAIAKQAFNIVTTTTFSFVATMFPIFGARFREHIYARTRKRLLALTKIRTAFANKKDTSKHG